MSQRLLPITLVLLFAGCGGDPPPGAGADPAAAAKPAGSGLDWSLCQLPGATLPVQGKLLIIDGGLPTPDAEPGREAIRRIEISVPGSVALLLTARDSTVWLVRASPETQVTAVFASGDGSQRITGHNIGPVQRAVSRIGGHACGRYWLEGGPGPTLDEATREVFGKPRDAIYTMRGGVLVIGGLDGAMPD